MWTSATNPPVPDGGLQPLRCVACVGTRSVPQIPQCDQRIDKMARPMPERPCQRPDRRVGRDSRGYCGVLDRGRSESGRCEVDGFTHVDDSSTRKPPRRVFVGGGVARQQRLGGQFRGEFECVVALLKHGPQRIPVGGGAARTGISGEPPFDKRRSVRRLAIPSSSRWTSGWSCSACDTACWLTPVARAIDFLPQRFALRG